MFAKRMISSAARLGAGRPLSFARFNSTEAAFTSILVEKKDKVAVVTLNRPKALNALNQDICRELGQAMRDLDADASVGCIVLTGSGDKAFAAGADIKMMQPMTYMDAYKTSLFGQLEAVARCRKPVIAAVNGFALGGGCELAMMCDFIIASDKAKFGQPEIKLGTIPGIGGTQRLTRLVGKSKAMDLVLTGRQMGAEEAERSGLVSRVVAHDKLMETVMEAATTIAGFSQPVTAIAKEAVNVALESSLEEGCRFERRLFYSTFATKDQKEGMQAFIDKRTPAFKDE